jgi:hypothetical protein
MTIPMFPTVDATLEIVAITGGRWHTPTPAELVAFVKWLRFTQIRTLVHGDCWGELSVARGVDAIVSRYVAFETDIRVEPWPALWGRFGDPAGPRRNGMMLVGDRRDWGGEDLKRPVHMLIAWPGNSGTANCVKQAKRHGIDVNTIADIQRLVREHDAAS